jgi:monoamine oxidase
LEIGKLGTGPAVKFFSEVGQRFWLKKKSAPSGGTLKLGQIWEGTDNQTQTGEQGIVLSVFAGPILSGPKGPRPPDQKEMMGELRSLYPEYTGGMIKKTAYVNWPIEPFIMTGYWTPMIGEIFKVGRKLNEPFHRRLFFAGEHTQLDHFGYMEGALRSGRRAAEQLMKLACGLLKEPDSPVFTAEAGTARDPLAFEYEFSDENEAFP